MLALLFVARVYRDVEHAALVWDDHVLVEGDAAYRHDSILQVMTESFWPESPLADARSLPYFRPAVLLSYRLDIALLGGNAVDFHVTSLLLHIAACAFLAIIAIRAGASYPGAVSAMLLWGVMPRLTEAVVWVSGRTDVLASFFGFAALAVWPELGVIRSRHAWARALFGAPLLFAALCSKEVAFAFVAVILLATWLKRDAYRDWKRPLLTIGLPVGFYVALRTIALAGRNATHRPLGATTRAATVLEAAERYCEMVADALRPRTSIGLVGEVDGLRAAIGALVIVLALGGIWHVVRRGSFGVRIGVALAVVAILPALHVVPIGLAGSVAADRLLYVPLAGLAIALAVVLTKRAAFAVPVLALLFGVATMHRVDDYLEETRFWTVAAETAHPHNTMPRLALAGWLAKAGEIEPACALYERAVSTDTTAAQHGRAREGLANCWAREGRYDEALAMAESVVADDPNNARAVLAVGFAELHRRDFDEATAAFDAAVRRDPMLRPYRPSRARLAKLRAEDALFADPAAQNDDPWPWANHLAELGRGPEASHAFLIVALDDTLAPALRHDATQYLMAQGTLSEADLALELVPPPPFGWDTSLEHLYARRLRVRAAFEELEPRIDALER